MKQNREDVNYYVGLDIGTSSVGWAVIDTNFNLLKKGNKNLWGSRLFDEGESKKQRRLDRATRRRYNKRRERIFLLRSIMENMILTIDPNFFLRMTNTSFLDEDDKKNSLKENYKDNYNLFCDKNYTDKDYYKQFPTIYHLRDYLCKAEEKVDPRLIYLAIHHIVKYRGNFLYEGNDFKNENIDLSGKLLELLKGIFEINSIEIDFSTLDLNEIVRVLYSEISKSEKVKECITLMPRSKEFKNIYDAFFKSIVGNEFNISKLFSECDFSDPKNMKLKLSDVSYEEKKTKIIDNLSEDQIDLLNLIESVYSWLQLRSIIGEDVGVNISSIMIKKYQQHEKDLKQLKNLIKKYNKKIYNQVFRDKSSKLNNYYNYINHPSKTKQDAFYKYILSIIKDIDSNDARDIVNKINREVFLNKQNSNLYGVFPYQMQKEELIAILNNQSKHYKELADNKDKIVSILEFKIPYYYGPLDGNEKYGWLVKKEGKEKERISPWNHEEMVDVDTTAENFIQRLISFCTYLPSEPVMPKNSLTCNKYEVLSELNKVRVNGKLIKADAKNRIIEDLFLKKKTVKEKDLIDWFIKNGATDYVTIEIKGLQKEKEFASSMNTWIDFNNIFGNINDSNFKMLEAIARDLTVFNERKIIKRRLKKIYKLTDIQIQQLLKLNYKGWSSLSYKLINGLYDDNIVGSSATILDVMEEKNLNLMEIINDDKFGYKQLIKEEYFKEDLTVNEEIDNLYCSPSVKKSIRQSILILDEICRYMKHKPNAVCIEFARNEDKKERTKSRITKLIESYDSIENKNETQIEILKELKKISNDEHIEDRIYLYYSQMCKCMYTGKTLDINNLSKYQIDHIIPQSLTIDDSLDNKVLVIAKENQRKLDDLTIPKNVQKNQIGFWKTLKESKLISEKKYSNLTRSEFNDSAIDKFINKHLVETRQSIKNVTNLISKHYSNTKVYAIRSEMTHNYRIKYDIPKVRILNDYHHAHDAYLCSILGLFINRCLPKLNGMFDYNAYMHNIKQAKNNHMKSGYVLNAMNYTWIYQDTGEVLWHPDYISKINKVFNYKDCFVTKKTEINDGLLFKATIMPNDKNSKNQKTTASVAVNHLRLDVHKYGGFTQVNYTFYAVEGRKNKKIERKIINVPLYLKNNNREDIIKYIETNYNLSEVKIIKEICKNQLIETKDGLFFVSSASELQNAKQLLLNLNETKKLSNVIELYKKNRLAYIEMLDLDELYVLLYNKMANQYPKYLNISKKIEQQKSKFDKLEIKEKCEVIIEIIKVMSAGATNGNLKNIGLSERVGRMSNMTIELNNTVFYNESVTGIYCKKVKL